MDEWLLAEELTSLPQPLAFPNPLATESTVVVLSRWE
jgi:hypothetical protein